VERHARIALSGDPPSRAYAGGVEASADRGVSRERAWWLRALLVLWSPHAVFSALRDEPGDAAEARQEPVLAILLVAGFSVVLGTSIAGRLLDEPSYDDPLLIAVWAFLGGAMYAAASYFLVGGLLHAGLRLAGGQGDYRRARHLLAYASVPLALSLLVWPVRIAVYGDDLFRRGGADTGAGNAAFEAIETGFLLWAAILVVVGVRTVERWALGRAVVASLPALAVPALALARAYGVI
jgi:hypothetical protein